MLTIQTSGTNLALIENKYTKKFKDVIPNKNTKCSSYRDQLSIDMNNLNNKQTIYIYKQSIKQTTILARYK